MDSTQIFTSADGFDSIKIGELTFKLDRQPDRPLLSTSMPRFRESYTTIDEAKWSEFDQFAVFNPPCLYQIQNGCVGHGTCTAAWLCWVAAGNDPIDFSPTWNYAMTNGGRDRGAQIGDTLASMQKYGLCTAKSFPESQCYASQATKEAYTEAAQYVLDDGYLAYSWEEVGTALHLGYQVSDSVMVGNGFMSVEGTVGGYPLVPDCRGMGNHCVVSGGLIRFKGKVYRSRQTSWGPSTPFGANGRFVTTREHDESQGQGFSAVVFRTMKPVPGTVTPTLTS